MPSCPVTKCFLAAAVFTAGLVQTQRLTPSALCFPSSLDVALAQPWRLLTAFLYADGFSPAFVLRLHLLACLSRPLEFCLAGPHPPSVPYLASSLRRTPLASVAAPLQYVVALLAGALFISLAAAARPTELGQPFLMTPFLFYLAYLYSRTPLPTAQATGGVGLPFSRVLPYALLLVLAAAAGASASLAALAGVGSGLMVELLDFLPLAEPLAAAAPPPPPPPAAAPRASPLSRRTGATLLLLLLAAVLHYADLSPPPPPIAAHSRLYSRQAEQLRAAARLDARAPPVTALLQALEGVNASRLAAGEGKPLSALQLLGVYQHLADFWAERTAAARAAGSGRSLRAKGSGAEKNVQLSDEKVAELEKMLAEALSRTTFSAETSDRDVLKQLLRNMPASQAAQIGQLPREQLLSTVSQHRESHDAAHKALAELGKVIEGLIANFSAAENAEASPQGVEVRADGAASEAGERSLLSEEVAFHMNKTLASFSIPIDMKDSEVLTEILAGTGTDKTTPAALMPSLLALVHDTRTSLLEAFITQTVRDIRAHLLVSEGDDGGEAKGALNASERAEVIELCAELLIHHDVEADHNNTKIAADLLDLLDMSPSARREGVDAIMMDSAAEWRRLKGVQDAVGAARAIVTAEAIDSVDIAENATFVSGTASAPELLQSHVATALAGYDVPAEMSDAEVLKEYLQLLSLDTTSLSTPMHYWLQSAIVAYRHSLVEAKEAKEAELLANASNASSNSTNGTSAANITAPTAQPPTMLDATIGTVAAIDLLDSSVAYPLTRAKSVRHVADDFSILLSGVVQLLGATSRLSVLCSSSGTAETPSDSAASESSAASSSKEAGVPSSRRCFAVVEARLGKSVKRLSNWISQHRKSLKAAMRNVKGAKEVWYRRDRLGFLWLALPFVPNAKEQYPGAPYLNFSSGASFPLPFSSQLWWEVEGEPLDSRGQPKAERQILGSVLSTM